VARICALCEAVDRSLDRQVRKELFDREVCLKLNSVRDLVDNLRHQTEASVETCPESSRRRPCEHRYLHEDAVLRAQVWCALHPLLQLKLRHPSAAVCVWISRRSDTVAAGPGQARRPAGHAAGRGEQPAGLAACLPHARQAQRRAALGHRGGAGGPRQGPERGAGGPGQAADRRRPRLRAPGLRDPGCDPGQLQRGAAAVQPAPARGDQGRPQLGALAPSPWGQRSDRSALHSAPLASRTAPRASHDRDACVQHTLRTQQCGTYAHACSGGWTNACM